MLLDFIPIFKVFLKENDDHKSECVFMPRSTTGPYGNFMSLSRDHMTSSWKLEECPFLWVDEPQDAEPDELGIDRFPAPLLLVARCPCAGHNQQSPVWSPWIYLSQPSHPRPPAKHHHRRLEGARKPHRSCVTVVWQLLSRTGHSNKTR